MAILVDADKIFLLVVGMPGWISEKLLYKYKQMLVRKGTKG
jgi:hypothetical protein